MSDQTPSMTGGCLCGAVRYETSAEPLWLCHCHCSMCRRQTGAALATYVIYPAGTVEWLQRKPTRYRSSKDVERSFCSTCGSTIGFHRTHETSIHLGSLDRPEDVVIDEVIFLKCFDTALDGRARYTGHTGFRNPECPAEFVARESIEARTVVVFDEARAE